MAGLLPRMILPVVCVFVSPGLAAGATMEAGSQNGSFVSSTTVGVGAVAGSIGSFGRGVRGQPYTLIQKTTRVQTLADGSHITHVQEERRMQDSQGRTRSEMTEEFNGASRIVFVTIHDPMTGTITTLETTGKRANVMHLPEPKPPTPEQQAHMDEMRAKAQAARADQPARERARPQITSEALPSRPIAGVYAEGRRTTRIIPAGREGNDRELRTTTEEWTSPDLHVALERTVDDPRMGKATTETTSLERAEPDPALFQVPAGYVVVDKSSQQF